MSMDEKVKICMRPVNSCYKLLHVAPWGRVYTMVTGIYGYWVTVVASYYMLHPGEGLYHGYRDIWILGNSCWKLLHVAP